jgi:hypothetical protein
MQYAVNCLEMSCGLNRVSAFLYEWVVQMAVRKNLNDEQIGKLFGEVEKFYWEMEGYTDEYKKESWNQEDWEDGGI